MHLNAFAGLSGAFILTFFLFNLLHICVQYFLDKGPHLNKHPSPNKRSTTGHNIKQTPVSNKRPLSSSWISYIVAIQGEWEDLFLMTRKILKIKSEVIAGK